MKRVQPRSDWPELWRQCYEYDLQEVYGCVSHRGYAYAYENRSRRTLKLLTDVLAPGASVLDVAAAQGNFSLALAERGFCVTWNDLRTDLMPYVQAKYELGSLSYAPGNAFDLDFDERFDAVVATEVIEHVAHPDRFLRQLAALCKPGGHIVLTTPNGGYFRNGLPRFSEVKDLEQYEVRQFGPNADDHIFLLHTDELRRFARDAGLEVERLELFTNPLTNGHIKLEPLLHAMPKAWVDGLERLSSRLPDAVARRFMVHTAARFKRA